MSGDTCAHASHASHAHASYASHAHASYASHAHAHGGPRSPDG
ncbi:hypothetical protein [Nocardioides marinus]|uniref:Uncharacterized protein n=1 Tax=Nocardioides marinus TaxID=374514 RepID=A0A7Y9YE96_9ACTN|nr:hypothetical protein [Nocardioides marinus]NYI09484.1 hypothetical protein [Nocardioides marinus]